MPPNPLSASCFSFQIVQVSPTSFAMARAASAIAAGGRSPAGVFTRSRAQQTASTRIAARLAAAFIRFVSQRDEPRTVTVSRSAPSPGAVLYRPNR